MSPDLPLLPDLSGDPPDIRLVTVDMDGTLLDEQHRVPDSLWRLLPELRRRGVLFCPASGRQYATLVAQFADVADDLAFIAENGSFVAQGGRELGSTTLGRDLVAEVVRTVRDLTASGVRVGAVVCGKRSAYVETVDAGILEEATRYYRLLEHVEDLLAVDDDVLKVAVFDAGSAAETTAPALEPLRATHQVVVSGRHWVDVMDASVHKGTAVRTLQRLHGITPQQTIAFGDYLNDLQMLDAAEHSFAMGNAHPEVLARARWTAPSHREDRVVRTLAAVLGITLDGPAPGAPAPHRAPAPDVIAAGDAPLC